MPQVICGAKAIPATPDLVEDKAWLSFTVP